MFEMRAILSKSRGFRYATMTIRIDECDITIYAIYANIAPQFNYVRLYSPIYATCLTRIRSGGRYV